MIKVYQIHLTEEEHNHINKNGWDFSNPKISAYANRTFGDVENVNMDFYTYVASVMTDDRETAFHIMNMWDSPELVTIYKEDAYSMSVGDVLEMEDGTRYLCSTFGFKEI